MKSNKKPAPGRKPQLNVALEADEKELVEKVAAARGVTVSSLIRMLAYDEARRLGIPTPNL